MVEGLYTNKSVGDTETVHCQLSTVKIEAEILRCAQNDSMGKPLASPVQGEVLNKCEAEGLYPV